MTDTAAKIILEDAHIIINEAKQAKSLFIKLAIVCLVTIILAIVTVTVNFNTQKEQGRKIDVLWSESMPIWLNRGITKLYTLNTEKIVARLTNDPKMIEDIAKYDVELNQNVEMLMNAISESRGGNTGKTRSLKSSDVEKGSAR